MGHLVIFDSALLGFVGISFLIAGFVKGVVGLGLPTISLALLTVFLDLPTAMALLVVPSLCTNVWQGLFGGHFYDLMRRLRSLFLAVIVMVWGGVFLSNQIETVVLTRFLGGLLVIYVVVSLNGVSLQIPRHQEKFLAPLCGVINGMLTGLTGCLFMPGVIYLQAIGLSRDQLIQAMGLLFALSTAALGVGLQETGRIDSGLWKISTFALLPAFLGMVCGRFFRGYLSEVLFQKLFLFALAVLGIYISIIDN